MLCEVKVMRLCAASYKIIRFINVVAMNNDIADNTDFFKIIGKLKLVYRSGTCDEVILKDEYQNSRFFAPEYRPRGEHIIVDIGAHIGVFSLLAAEKAMKGRVYSIEADEQNYHYLKTNVELNDLSNISTYLLALTNYRGTGKLYFANANRAHSLCEPVSENWNEVTTDTLANFIVDNSINHVDYMKINVEGAEYSILLSTPKSIMKRIRLMLIEFHPSDKHNEHDLKRYLEHCGFTMKINYCSVHKGKGWIIAKLAS